MTYGKFSCICWICMRHRRIERVKKLTRSKKVRALIDELHDTLSQTEDRLNWHQANQDGSWPTAREYAEKIIRKCDAAKAQEA